MAANKRVHEPGKEFDCSGFHGKYATINMSGQDVGYARVGIIWSDRNYILFQFRGRYGLANKAYVKDITEVRMTERMLRKETPLEVCPWSEHFNPYLRFVGQRCDIHMHQTRMFEASPGFFGAKILYLDRENGLIRIKENSKQFNVSIAMICGIMES
ncbi:MAG: hypothetical protein LUC32_06370 [Clostridiales bacterium]|nr:hypothetical protein [Lachnospiraceae bacterium]MCD8324556.1 hypothetical protein [Clostridiales bacterium]